MNIDLGRLCKLAGLENSKSSRLMRESVDMEMEEGEMPEASYMEEVEMEEGEMEEDEMEEDEMEEADMEEMLEIDETMLVQELRRAKKMMIESKKVQKRRQKNLLEAELKTIIESEVENVLKDLNMNSSWIYGNKKPRKSKHGFSHQGSFLKGMGFK